MTEARRYEVLAVLGRGGFGTVYHARFLGEGGFSKEVALKVLNADMENVAEVASRLRDEARVLGLLRHRAIVAVDRLTQIDGRWTVVMEYVDGHDLSQLLRQGAFPLGPALEITAEVAGALHAAYTRLGPNGQPLRLLHRDLKPSNVRITPFGEVKVLDFGIARAEFQEREAKTRSLAFGTPEYMSPERLDMSDDGAPGDVYALGVVLFELITGSSLGRSSANPHKHTRRLDQVRETLREADTPPTVADLVTRMLSFEASARPTAAEIERLSFDLARKLGETSLRSWADEVIPTLTADTVAPAAEVELTGSILVERPAVGTEEEGTVWEPSRAPAPVSGQPRTPPARLVPAATGVEGAALGQPAAPEVRRTRPPPPVARTAGRPFRIWRWLLAGVAAMTGFGLLLGAIWWLSRVPTVDRAPETVLGEPLPETAATATTTGILPSEPVDAVGPTSQAATNPLPSGPGTSSTSSTSSTARRVAKDAPLATSSEQTPSTPAKVKVRLQGDADGAYLTAKGQTYVLPSEVFPGTYTILASFGGGPALSLGSATIKEGEPVVVRCAEQFGKCSVAKEGQ